MDVRGQLISQIGDLLSQYRNLVGERGGSLDVGAALTSVPEQHRQAEGRHHEQAGERREVRQQQSWHGMGLLVGWQRACA
jgi:hypothetical protein